MYLFHMFNPFLRVLRVSVANLFLLSIASSVHSKILFHSNFENERTYTAKALKPGAKRIELLPSPEIEQWFPETGGEAIIEPNYPRNREVFKYMQRRGNALLGVTNIAKPHVRHVAIRTGGLAEWFTDRRRLKQHTNSMIRVEHDKHFGQRFSACIDCNAMSLTVLRKSTRFPETRYLHTRFVVRFSESFLQFPFSKFPISRIGFQKTSSLLLCLHNSPRDSLPSLELANSKVGKIVSNNIRIPVAVRPKARYLVETSLERLQGNRFQSQMWINGKLVSSCLSEHAFFEDRHDYAEFGKSRRTAIPGKIWLNEVAVADARIGALARQPCVSLKENGFVVTKEPASFYTSLSWVSHWQVAKDNAWLMPAFSSGLDSNHLQNLPQSNHLLLPTDIYEGMDFDQPEQALLTIPAGRTALARVRHLHRNGLWSPWSEPLSFTVPPPPEALARQSIGIKDAWITAPDKTKRIRFLEREKWYDFHFRFTPLTIHSFLDVYLTGNPEVSPANYWNRGGNFHARDNYPFSLGFHQKGIWAKQQEGENYVTCLIGTMGVYCDDRPGVSLLDNSKGEARVRIRILGSATPGTWRLSAFLAEGKKGVSNLFHSLFFVGTQSDTQTNSRPIAVAAMAVTGIVGFLLLALVYRTKRAGRSEGTEEAKGSPIPKDATYNERVQQANQFILENFGRPISLQDVADAVSLSTGWLSQLFKEEVGKNVVTYINELRVQKARELLCNTNMKMNEIAYKAGFNSVGNFNITFKRMAGLSPRECRNKARE